MSRLFEVGATIGQLGRTYRVTDILRNANESLTGEPLHQVNLVNESTGEPTFTYATDEEVSPS